MGSNTILRRFQHFACEFVVSIVDLKPYFKSNIQRKHSLLYSICQFCNSFFNSAYKKEEKKEKVPVSNQHYWFLCQISQNALPGASDLIGDITVNVSIFNITSMCRIMYLRKITHLNLLIFSKIFFLYSLLTLLLLKSCRPAEFEGGVCVKCTLVNL